MIRKSLCLLAAFSFTSLAHMAHAQFAVYGTISVQRLSSIQNSPVATGPQAQGATFKDTVDPLGGTFGAYYDFVNFGPVRLGADVRGTILTTNLGARTGTSGPGARIDSGLAGLRASFNTRYAPIKPYLQASGGIGRTNYGVLGNNPPYETVGIQLVSNFEYHVYAGVDLKILPVMDFRVVELGYGGLDPFGNNAHNYPLKSISSGVVFHLP